MQGLEPECRWSVQRAPGPREAGLALSASGYPHFSPCWSVVVFQNWKGHPRPVLQMEKLKPEWGMA